MMSDIFDDLQTAIEDAADETSFHVTKALADSDESHMSALSRCGGESEECVTLVEKWLAADDKLRKFQVGLAALVAKHQGDERYQRLCRRALESRADLAMLEIQESFSEWWPGCSRIKQPH